MVQITSDEVEPGGGVHDATARFFFLVRRKVMAENNPRLKESPNEVMEAILRLHTDFCNRHPGGHYAFLCVLLVSVMEIHTLVRFPDRMKCLLAVQTLMEEMENRGRS